VTRDLADSSTASIDQKHSTLAWLGSSGTEELTLPVHVVPRSAETRTTACAFNIPVEWISGEAEWVSGEEDLWTPVAEQSAGIVICRYSDPGEGVELPTRWFAESLQSTGLIHRVSIEGLSEHLVVLPSYRDLVLPAMATMRMPLRQTTAAQPQARRSTSDLMNSTDVVTGVPPLVQSKFTEAAALAAAESFEDGVDSKFAQTLSTLAHAYGIAAIAAVENFVRSPSSNVEIAVEAAEWLGEAEHPASQRYRRTLLEWLLGSASTRLRHGAAAGLASMDDPSSLPALRVAYDRESNQRLRKFLGLVVDQLERTEACLSS
jgi:hypothetical protein